MPSSMHLLRLILYIFLLLFLYTWIGYPTLVRALARARSRLPIRGSRRPTVSIIIAAHNEEGNIAAKLRNSLSLDYPADCLEIMVASDGSTDRTDAIVEEFAASDPRIRLLRTEGRAGKSGAQNLAATH